MMNASKKLDDSHYRRASSIIANYIFVQGDSFTLKERFNKIKASIFDAFVSIGSAHINSRDILFREFLKNNLGDFTFTQDISAVEKSGGLIVFSKGRLLLDTRDKDRISKEDEINILKKLIVDNPERAEYYTEYIKYLETKGNNQ